MNEPTRINGGLKAAQVLRSRYGKDYYAKIGRLGGAKSKGGGFTGNPERAKAMAKIGGFRSKKGYKFLEETETKLIYRRLNDDKIVEFAK